MISTPLGTAIGGPLAGTLGASETLADSHLATVLLAAVPDGVELQLDSNDNPAAKAYQQVMVEQGQRAATFYVDDVQREYERMTAAGAAFTMPPTKVTGSTIAVLNDTVGISSRSPSSTAGRSPSSCGSG
jgi:hypothetical protein